VKWIAILALLCLFPRPAQADDDDEPIEPRTFGFAERGPNLVVSVTFADAFDAQLLADLESGFTTTLVVRAYVYPDKAGELPVAFTAATMRVVYDLWAESYEIQVDDSRGRRRFSEKSQAEALKRVTTLGRFPVAPLTSLPIGKVHFVGLIVEVNPVSEELLAEVRRWLARDADQAKAAGDSSFFGSFVSIFVNPKIPVADRVLRLRSQSFFRQKR
jgi:hypothetical protein